MTTRIYLDHAATTPVRKDVREAMLPFLGEESFGNPSSGHHYGRLARAALEAARKRVARCARAGVAFHTDAVQALGKVPVKLSELPGVTFCSVSAHKIGGPKGVGAIFVRERRGVLPLLHGGGQQGGLRPGTENVPGA